MRIIHFSDNHLGAGAGQREQDILDSFSEAVDKIIDLKPDLVINAGDLFDAVRPTNRVIAWASQYLLKLGREAKIPTVIISGNHDAPKQRQIGAVLSIFREYENIHVIYRSRFERIRIGDCAVACVPHCLTNEILKEELDKAVPDPEAKYNILVLHGVAGGIREFEMADISEQEIPSAHFAKGFDYVALGHYHNFIEVDQGNPKTIVYYSGSTERLSQSEAGHKKGFIELDLVARQRKPVFHEITTRRMYDIAPVTAKGRSADEIIAELESKVKSHQPEDSILRLKITDIPEETYRALPFDKIAQLRNESFSLDIKFEKEEREEDHQLTDINLGRLTDTFTAFVAGRAVENLDKERLKSLASDYLTRAEADDGSD